MIHVIKEFFADLYEDTTPKEKVVFTVIWILLFSGCIAIVVFLVWAGYMIWFDATHHCVSWSQTYWSEDHYGKPVLTRDCTEWSK